MQNCFPELAVCHGFAVTEGEFGNAPECFSHWWLKDKDGEIIDPMAHHYKVKTLVYADITWKVEGVTPKYG